MATFAASLAHGDFVIGFDMISSFVCLGAVERNMPCLRTKKVSGMFLSEFFSNLGEINVYRSGNHEQSQQSKNRRHAPWGL